MLARSTVILVLATIGAGSATAADTETRVYGVQVDGKPAGEFRLTVRTGDDGTETATAAASVQVRSLLGGYRYVYRGNEVWKNGRLRFDSASDDNGKKHTIAAEATANGMRLTVDGNVRTGRLDAWPTTYWRMPPGAKAGQAIILLDADTGEENAAKIAVLGQQGFVVAGKELNCTRVTVAGPTPATMWYDARGRMVGQATTEDGHETMLSLREIQR